MFHQGGGGVLLQGRADRWVRNHSSENDFDLHENETACRTLFHMKGFALRLVLKQRQLQVYIEERRSSFASIEFLNTISIFLTIIWLCLNHAIQSLLYKYKVLIILGMLVGVLCEPLGYRLQYHKVLHGRNNENALHKNIFHIGKIIFCSCHATWLPCKTSIH